MLLVSVTVRHDLTEQQARGTRLQGHGGADFHAMEAFIKAIGVSSTTRF